MLTLEQKREVANAITGNEYLVVETARADRFLHSIESPAWRPDLNHAQWKALIRFIAKQFDILECAIPIDKHGPLEDMERDFIEAIRENDVDALEDLAHELIGYK